MTWSAEDMGALSGQVAIVTGTSGLATAIVAALARAGAQVIMAGRSQARGAEVLAGLRAEIPGADLAYRQLDLASLASVQAFVAGLDLDRIEMLVLNAAVLPGLGPQQTEDGFEMIFGVNHLGHFALTLGLLPLLSRSRARVVSLASGAHKRQEFDFDDLMGNLGRQQFAAYGRSKLACLMFAKELDRRSRTGGWGVTSVAAQPGFARTQGVFDRLDTVPVVGWLAGRTLVPLLSHPPGVAAEAILYAATAPEVSGGAYFGPTGWGELTGPVGPATTDPYASREDVAAQLWDASETLVGLRAADVMASPGG